MRRVRSNVYLDRTRIKMVYTGDNGEEAIMTLPSDGLGHLIKYLAQQRAQMEPPVAMDEANLITAIQMGKTPEGDKIAVRLQIGNFGWVDAIYPSDEWLSIAERLINLIKSEPPTA